MAESPTLTQHTVPLVHTGHILQRPCTVHISVSAHLKCFFSKQHTIDMVLLGYSVILCLLNEVSRSVTFNMTATAGFKPIILLFSNGLYSVFTSFFF